MCWQLKNDTSAITYLAGLGPIWTNTRIPDMWTTHRQQSETM